MYVCSAGPNEWGPWERVPRLAHGNGGTGDQWSNRVLKGCGNRNRYDRERSSTQSSRTVHEPI